MAKVLKKIKEVKEKISTKKVKSAKRLELEAVIKAYAEKNPEKYALKKAHFDAQLKSL